MTDNIINGQNVFFAVFLVYKDMVLLLLCVLRIRLRIFYCKNNVLCCVNVQHSCILNKFITIY